jgi:SAM-dependent methyltransferase
MGVLRRWFGSRKREAANRIVPHHWETNSWDEKARENPLYAIMTTPEMRDADTNDFSDKHLRLLFEKGRKLVDAWVLPSLEAAPAEGLVVEYGCGAGRILNALVERDIPCAGIDVSQTMLDHCRRLVPGVESLTGLTDDERVPLPDGIARLVYSHAVVQHIDKLSTYETAISEMCRLLVPGGRLVLQLNREDFTLASNGQLGRTENFEDHSLHHAPGSTTGIIHQNTSWSGVYIGFGQLKDLLSRNCVTLLATKPFNEKKPRAVVILGEKSVADPGA